MRAEQSGSDGEERKKKERTGEKFAGLEREGETRRRVGRVTGKAAGSAGVCTTDTCLDSITGSGSHSFLPIKTEKTDPPPPRPSASPPSQVLLLLHLLLLPAVSVTASSHPMPPSTTLCSPPPSSSSSVMVILPTGSSRYVCEVEEHVRGRIPNGSGGRAKGAGWRGEGLADAFRSFISSVIHLFPTRDSRPALS